MIDPGLVPYRRNVFHVRETGNEILIISGKRNEISTLNSVGSFIWKCIDGERSLEEIYLLVCEEFDVPKKIACRDTGRFIEQLKKKSLIAFRQDEKISKEI